MKTKKNPPFILWFDEIGIDQIALVGGKNGSLGEILQHPQAKIKIPEGFAITSFAYRYLLEKSNALPALKALFKDLDITDGKALREASQNATKIILNCKIPKELEEAIKKAYQKLSKICKAKNIDVAVRSSATAEDLPTASFAGQQESFLHIKGEKELLKAVLHCFASLFKSRAIAYREENGFDHFKVFLSIGVQRMVRSDLASSGVIFTLDTESGFKDVIYLTGSYGLGESIVQGAVNPDEFYVFKPTLKQGFKAIIDKRVGEKAIKLIYSKTKLKQVKTSSLEQKSFCLNDKEVLTLSKWAIAIEEYYSKKYGKWTPMDIEWAKDGITKELYIVQARPETVQSQKKSLILEEFKLKGKGKILTTGKSVGSKIAVGKANVIKSAKEISKFKKGEILVTEITDPDWVPIMKAASAIVTNRGGRTSHAAIVSRELGLPCIVGTNNATNLIKPKQKITVSCSQGENGIVYDGFLPFTVTKTDLSKTNKPKTKVMVNIGSPDDAFTFSFLGADGVGLIREEFIVTEYIRIHPMALIHFDTLKDKKAKKEIEKLTVGYKDKKEYFIDKLKNGVAIIAAAFYPNDVILRFSDFKTNEYMNLIGGKEFEPLEENPMLGFRGAARYYHPDFQEAFQLECQAIKKVRDDLGLRNLKVMIPMCRTPEEGEKVLSLMKKEGLVRGKNDLEVYVMCEIPSNILLAEKFCDLFDGFSIGSNDLTQLTLGVDRDSARVSSVFDENNDAIKQLIQTVIKIAKKRKKKIGICGDAPSTYPEFAKFLIDAGIDSISLSPDAFLKTKKIIADYEHKKKMKGKK